MVEKTLQQETAPSHLPQSEVSTLSDPSKLWYTIKKFSFLHTFSPEYVKYKLLLLPQSFFLPFFNPTIILVGCLFTLIAIVSSLGHSASTISTLKETL